MKTEIKQGGVESFSWINSQFGSLHGENRQFVGLLEHDLMTAIHKLRENIIPVS